MSTLPVRYTNHHHVVPPKTASPVVVAVNKAAVAGCVQSAHHHHHHHHHQKQLQRSHNHQTPPVRRHPTKMAAGRRAKSNSRTRSAAAAMGSSSPSKRRNGKAGAKKAAAVPKLKAVGGAEQASSSTAQNMLLDVAVVVPGIDMDTSLGGVNGCAAGGEREQPTTEWRTAVGGDVLRTPDAAGERDRLPVAHIGIEDQLETEQQVEKGGEQHNDHLMDTSEPMDEVASSSSNGVTHETADAAIPEPRRSNEELFPELQEALAMEPKYQPTLYLPQSSQDGEITIGARDGAAHVLRCLKVWYELPTDVLFAAINLVDRFLAKMKVKPKHLACISVGSLYLAAEQLLGTKMNADDLALISQCRCTAGDLLRMSGIIANKLGVQPGTAPVTALTFIRLFYHLFRNAAHELGLQEFYEKSISLAELEQRLEVLACDANCSSIRASELALVLICTQMDSHAKGVVNHQIGGLVDYAIEVQKLARIPDQTFFQSHASVVAILARYNSSQHKMPYKQRLVWKLSSRTMRVLRPSNKMTSYLPTIDEHNQANFDSLSRFRTGSLSSEDDEDWPTSPVVPVYEDLC